MRSFAMAALAVVASGCGVDRASADHAMVHVMFDLPAPEGGAARNDRGLFDLAEVGAYAVVTVSAEDIATPIVADWPDAPNPPGAADIEIMVPAGTDRAFEALVLVWDEDQGLSAHAGQTSKDLVGGTEMDVDLQVDPISCAAVDETIDTAGAPDPGQVVAVHPVDVEHDVLYPAATFTAGAVTLEVHAEALPSGRPVRWTLLTLSGDWVDADEETLVP